MLPRVDLLDRVATGATPWAVSLHMISGRPEVQLLLFAIAAFCAFCLLIGHRTRLFTVLSWLLLLSLQNRNTAILNAGDVLFRMLLFWSMFLPLGARGSVDAAMREPREDGPDEGGHRTWSVPAFCFMAQVSIVYWATALLKTDPIWTEDRTAVWHALKLDYMALPLATLMREWPPGLLELVARGTLLLEFWAPFLIWIPVFVGPLRLTACAVMIALHAGFTATLQLGLFSYVCGAMWLALLPPAAWDRLFARFRRDPRRLGMTLHYDGDCGFCRRMVLVIRSFFLLPETAVARAQDDPAIERAMRRRDSWVVTDHEGKQHYKWEALAYVLSRSPWAGPVGAVLGAAVFRRPGTWLYEQTASRRELMGRLTAWMRPRPARPVARPLAWAGNAVLLGTLAYVVVWNARGFHTKEIFAADSTAGGLSAAAAGWMTGSRPGQAPGPDLRWYGRVLRVSQQWSMFAPYPSRSSGWYVVVGTLNDGTQVDLYRHVVLGEKLAQVSWERPDPIVETFHGTALAQVHDVPAQEREEGPPPPVLQVPGAPVETGVSPDAAEDGGALLQRGEHPGVRAQHGAGEAAPVVLHALSRRRPVIPAPDRRTRESGTDPAGAAPLVDFDPAQWRDRPRLPLPPPCPLPPRSSPPRLNPSRWRSPPRSFRLSLRSSCRRVNCSSLNASFSLPSVSSRRVCTCSRDSRRDRRSCSRPSPRDSRCSENSSPPFSA